MKQSKGTKLAAEIRAKCNTMTKKQREEAYKESINIIHEASLKELREKVAKT